MNIYIPSETGVTTLPILKYLTDFNVEITRTVDFSGKFPFYGVPLTKVSGKFKDYIIKRAKKADIIHINYHFQYVSMFRKVYPKKKIILHLRGSETRNNTELVNRACKIADKVLYSSPDLKKYLTCKAEYVHRCIDVEHFSPREITSDKRLTFKKKHIPEKLYTDHFNKMGVNVELVPQFSVPYKDMPDFLSGYGFYYSVGFDKNGKLIRGNKWGSKTSLEAYSLGLRSFNTAGEEYTEPLPPEFYPINVAKKIAKIYRSL